MLNMLLHPFVSALRPFPAGRQLCSAASSSCAACTSVGPSLEQGTASGEGGQAPAPGSDSCISQFSSLRRELSPYHNPISRFNNIQVLENVNHWHFGAFYCVSVRC